MLRRHDAARAQLVLTAARRRIFGEYKSSEPSRFIDEVPAELIDRIVPTHASGYQGNFRTTSSDQSIWPRRPWQSRA